MDKEMDKFLDEVEKDAKKSVVKVKDGDETRWIVHFLGNAAHFEHSMEFNEELARECCANALVFNYRGVGGSEGVPWTEADLVRGLRGRQSAWHEMLCRE